MRQVRLCFGILEIPAHTLLSPDPLQSVSVRFQSDPDEIEGPKFHRRVVGCLFDHRPLCARLSPIQYRSSLQEQVKHSGIIR